MQFERIAQTDETKWPDKPTDLLYLSTENNRFYKLNRCILNKITMQRMATFSDFFKSIGDQQGKQLPEPRMEHGTSSTVSDALQRRQLNVSIVVKYG